MRASLGACFVVVVALAGCDRGPAETVACPRAVCSDHGECAESNEVNARPTCTCDEGYAGFTCADCTTGFHRGDNDSCVADVACATDSCGPHGTCSASTGVVTCACDPGYTGDKCENCYAGYHLDGEACVVDQKCLPNSCSQAGDCVDTTGVVVCTCAEGYTGAVCDACGTGYHRDTANHCLVDILCVNANPCSTHGTCDESSGVTVCHCDPGYTGAACDDCYPGYHDAGGSCQLDEQCRASSCSGAAAGACGVVDGLIECTCFSGYIGDECETCDAGYHRDATLACVPDESCALSSNCSSHSTCDDSTGVIRCVCDDGYAGAICSDCYPGYHDDGTGVCVIDQHCAYVVNGNAVFSCGANFTSCDDTGGVVTCVCNSGFEGDHCEFNIDDCVNTACNELGGNRCIDLVDEHLCLCEGTAPGTYGLSCP